MTGRLGIEIEKTLFPGGRDDTPHLAIFTSEENAARQRDMRDDD